MRRNFTRGAAFLSIVLILLACACKKGPGEGGHASISGKVFVMDFSVTDSLNNPFPPYFLQDSYYSPGEDVFILYGDEQGIGEVVKTDYSGTYVFEFLRKGTYKIYMNSRDTSSPANTETYVIMRTVEISGRKEKVVLEDFVVNR